MRLAAKAPGGLAGRRLWEWVESEHSRQMADDLRKDKLRVPIAGVSHWRREHEFNHAQAAPGLDLIDDRLYWTTIRAWVVAGGAVDALEPRRAGLTLLADEKRRTDRPYVVGQWCNQTFGAWSTPTEAADFLLGVYTAGVEDWDALVRRGVFLYPVNWGEGPVGLSRRRGHLPVARGRQRQPARLRACSRTPRRCSTAVCRPAPAAGRHQVRAVQRRGGCPAGTRPRARW